MKGIENEMRLRREVVMMEVRWYFELWSMLKCWLNNEWMCSIEWSKRNERNDITIETGMTMTWNVWNGVWFVFWFCEKVNEKNDRVNNEYENVICNYYMT